MTENTFNKAKEIMAEVERIDELQKGYLKILAELQRGTAYENNRVYADLHTGETSHRMWIEGEDLKTLLRAADARLEGRRKELMKKLEKL